MSLARASSLKPFLGAAPSDAAASLLAAAQNLLSYLEAGRAIDTALLRSALAEVFGGSDAAGAWDWKTACDAGEAATVLFLRRYGPTILRKSDCLTDALPVFSRIARLLPTWTRRLEESVARQQFSTPIPLGLAVFAASGIRPGDRVLEPAARILAKSLECYPIERVQAREGA